MAEKGSGLFRSKNGVRFTYSDSKNGVRFTYSDSVVSVVVDVPDACSRSAGSWPRPSRESRRGRRRVAVAGKERGQVLY